LCRLSPGRFYTTKVDCDRYTVSRRYDRLATFIPLFDRILFLPKDSRRMAVDRLGLRAGDKVLDVGCGTGRSLGYLHKAVGPTGRVYGIDISPGMLRKAQKSCDANRWDNVELMQCDAAAFTAPAPLDGVLFSLSYNTMPDHRAVLRRAWDQLVPGGRLVIMDAKVPPGLGGRFVLPFSLWLMKHTMLGNPLIHPWEELASLTEHWDMAQQRFNSYYVCCGIKRVARISRAADVDMSDTAYMIAAG
jgi:demethylmenaquinone methyltransferase/2-methoxy-6-polyprenyl-1,4-benzoquinol methylase